MKKYITLAIILLLLLSIKPFLYWQNNTVGITNYVVSDSKIPAEFDNYKIVLIADIQGDALINTESALNKIKNQNADVILIAGDLMDQDVAGSDDVFEDFLDNMGDKVPMYAVSGNHDLWTDKFDYYIEKWSREHNITFVENTDVSLEKNKKSVKLFGISDPYTWFDDPAADYVKSKIAEQTVLTENYNILLFHRANMLDLFKDTNYDLILSGHMHGGQIRLPFIGGLRSPHGDWLPKYSGGRYDMQGKTYIVSRGICNIVAVPRIFNRPEIVVITLKAK